MLQHVAQHHITTRAAVLGMTFGVVIGGSLEHAHKDGRFVGGEVLGQLIEISLGGSLDAKSIGTEINGVGIHRDNIFLAVT